MTIVNQRTLDLYPIDYPFETLVSRMTADQPKLILNPDFQRKYKWDKDGWGRASKFIESCLMRIPLPSCYFAEDDQARHIVIDGVQRLTTVLRFFQDEFALESMSTFRELDGKKFSQLGDLRSELEATTIRCIVLRKSNSKPIVREIFSRLNQGAVELSEQEIRHALFPGAFDDLLSELAQVPTIANFGRGPASTVVRDSREGDEQVLRYFAFRESLDRYDSRRLGKFLDEVMEAKSSATPNEIDALRKDFKDTIARCIEVFGGDVFVDKSKSRTRQSMVYYDLLMSSLRGLTTDQVTDKKEEIKKAFKELCASTDFQKTLSGGLQNKSSIERRRSIWQDLLARAIK
jgi:hypothetical protein